MTQTVICWLQEVDEHQRDRVGGKGARLGRSRRPRHVTAAGGPAGRLPCTTTATNQELGRLARLIQEAPELRRVFRDEPPERVAERLRAVPAGPAFLAALDAFLRHYGDRESTMPAACVPRLVR